MGIYEMLKWLIPIFVGIAMFFNMKRRGLIRTKEVAAESNEDYLVGDEQQHAHLGADAGESSHVDVVQMPKKTKNTRASVKSSSTISTIVKPLAKKTNVAPKEGKPVITYDYEVRGRSVYIYRDGRSVKVMSLCLNATGKCGIEGEWLLMETRVNTKRSSIWEARCIPRNGNMGGYTSERSVREAVRKRK